MAAPVVPSVFKTLISDPNSTMCSNFVKTLLQLPVRIYQLFNWMFTSAGDFSPAAKRNLIPSGMIMNSFVLLTDDTNWLLCDGRQVVILTYPELYAAIGDGFGVSSDPLEFVLPDCRAKSLVGVGSFTSGAAVALGQDVGEEKHALLPAEESVTPDHQHIVGRFDLSGGNTAGWLLTGSPGVPAPDGTCERTGAGDSPATSTLDNLLGHTLGDYALTAKMNQPGPVPAVTAHNNLPPLIGAYTYIKT